MAGLGLRKNAFEVKWRVENAHSWFQTRDDTLYSPQFLAETLMNTRWKLSLSTNWQLAEKYLSLTVQRDVEDSGPEFIALNYELSFMACEESCIISKSCKSKFFLKTAAHELNVKQIEILNEKKDTYLPEGDLTVRCKFWYVSSTVPKGGQCSIRSVIGTNCITLDGAIDNISTRSGNVTVNFMSLSSEISFISFNVCGNQNGFVTFERVEVECKCFRSYSCKLFALSTRERILLCDSTSIENLLSSHTPITFRCNWNWSALQCSYFLRNDTLNLQLEITYCPGVSSECIEYDVNNYKKVADESADLENVNSSNSKISDHPSLSEYEEAESSDEDECFDTAGMRRHLPSTTLKNDLTSLLNDRLFCDTKLQTDNETFPAHRNVLSARSPVFKKMFTTDMKEAAGECINVPDINSDTVRRMLRFLYTDHTGDLEMQSAKDLYTASDKYDIASLKHRCSSFIKKNLCPANVCEVLVLADMHQDKDLESAAQEYVLAYDKEVLGSEEWKLFMKKFTSLAAQVMYLKCMKE